MRWGASYLFICLALGSFGCSSGSVKETDSAEATFREAERLDDKEYYDEALEKYKEVEHKHPYSKFATEAKLRIANIHFKEENFVEAQNAYQLFKELHPKHGKSDFVTFRLALSYFSQLPSSTDRDISLANKAIQYFDEVISSYPTSEYVTQARDKKKEALNQIESLSDEAIESMIEQQKARTQTPVFRMIVSGQIESSKIAENGSAIAVLDIKPISDGHIIIIPKEEAKTIKEIPKEAFSLADEVSKKLKTNLEAKSVEILPAINFGEAIINVIPVYDKSKKPLTLNSKRTEKTPEELSGIKSKLDKEIIKKEVKIEKIKISKKKTPKSQILRLSKRIP